MTIPILTRALPPLALALALGAAVAPSLAQAQGHAGDRPRASGAGLGVSISSVQAGYSFGGGSNYRVNGPSVIQPGAVWVPIRVTLRNDDASDAVGRVVIPDDPQGNNNGNGGNNGGPTYHTDYTTDVQLPQGSRKAVTLYIRAADAGSGLTVDLQVGGKTVDSKAVSLIQQQGDTLAAGVLSDDTGVRPSFQSLKFGDTAVAAAGLVALAGPSANTTPLDTQPQALDNFDLIVLSDYASDSLTGPQLDALRAWVHGGGTLLVAGGAHAQKTLGHLPADLLAATSTGGAATTVASSLPEVARLATVSGAGAAGGQVELSVAAPRSGATVLLAHNGVPLIVDRPAGRGHLVYSAFEPTSDPLKGYSDGARGAFWERALAAALQGPRDALVESAVQASSGSAFGPPGQNNLAAIAGDVGKASRGLPALQVYVFLIVLYVLVLGPGNYLLLRWRRRLELSWVTVPVLAVLFGLGSFGLAYARNGGDVLANVDSVVYLDPGAPTMQTDSYIGLFAPFRGDYDLTEADPNATAASTLAWGLGNDSGQGALSSNSPLGMRVDEGVTPFTARLTGLQMWSQRNIGLHRQLPQQGDVTGNLTLRGKAVAGTVTNRTTMTLRDCMIVGANGVSAIIPRIAPGATARVPSFSLGSGIGAGSSSGSGYNGNGAPAGPLNGLYSGDPSGSGMLASAKRYNDILSGVFPGGSVATVSTPLVLMGWTNSPIGALTVNGATPRRADLDLVVVPLGLAGAPGGFTLSPGDLPVGVVGTTVTQGNGSSGLMLNAGDRVDVQLVLPATTAGRARRVDTLSLVTNPTNGSSSLVSSTAKLWNWRTRHWQGVDLSGGTLDVHNAAPYVSPDGRVLLRLEAPSGGSLSFNNVDQNIQIGASGSVS